MTRLRGFAVLFSALIAAVGLGTVTAPAQADPHYAEPSVGECHDYSYKTLAHHSEGSPAQVCDGTQSAMTFAVVVLPKRIGLNSTGAARYALPKCDKAFAKALGGRPTTWALTAYSTAWYVPTKAQQRQGAHWVRCDAVLYGGHNKLAPVPTSLKLGRPPLDDAVAKCLVSAAHHSYPTVCDRRHDFRSKKALQLRGSHYPTAQQFGQLVARRCPRLYFIPPSADAWRAGYKILVCYAKTSH
jgi:putative regulator of septum formation